MHSPLQRPLAAQFLMLLPFIVSLLAVQYLSQKAPAANPQAVLPLRLPLALAMPHNQHKATTAP